MIKAWIMSIRKLVKLFVTAKMWMAITLTMESNISTICQCLDRVTLQIVLVVIIRLKMKIALTTMKLESSFIQNLILSNNIHDTLKEMDPYQETMKIGCLHASRPTMNRNRTLSSTIYHKILQTRSFFICSPHMAPWKALRSWETVK